MILDDFLVRATLAGLGLAVAAGPLGCFVVWRRMAYFGDAVAHAAILGVALALILEVSVAAGVLAVAVATALVVSGGSGQRIGIDTMLGVAAHGGLALGVVALSLAGPVGVDVESYLFGEILAVGTGNLALIWGGAVVVAGVIAWRWNRLLTATLDADLAVASGIDPMIERRILMLLLAVVVAVALKVVGALLVTAMLIIPAAAARPLSRSPEVMALAATVIGAGSVMGGIEASVLLDTPTGPSIVVAATLVFAASAGIAGILGSRRLP